MAFVEVPQRIRAQVNEHAGGRDVAPEKGWRTLLKPRWVHSDVTCEGNGRFGRNRFGGTAAAHARPA